MDDDALIHALKEASANTKLPVVTVRDPHAPSNTATEHITVFCKHCKTSYSGKITYWKGYRYCMPKDGDGMDWCPACIGDRVKAWCKHAWNMELDT